MWMIFSQSMGRVLDPGKGGGKGVLDRGDEPVI